MRSLPSLALKSAIDYGLALPFCSRYTVRTRKRVPWWTLITGDKPSWC